MFARRVLLLAGLTLLLVAPARAAALGPAYFVRATGGMYTAALHPSGLSVYSNAPAYVVLQASPSTTILERDATNHNFPWVAIRDTRGGRAGIDCFSNGHLVTAKSRVDRFTDNRVQYDGLFMLYSSWHFKAGAGKPSACAPARGGATVLPSITSSATSVTLHLDCLIRSCTGTLIAFGQAGLCSHPGTVSPGHVGCPPVVTGNFTISGGLSVNLKLPLNGRSLRSILLAITVNGKQGPFTRLASLPRTFQIPPKARRASLTVTCPTTGTLGSPVTVTGTLAPAAPKAPITLTFLGSGGKPQTQTVTSSANGTFSSQFTPRSGRDWVLNASFAGDRTRTHAEQACGFTVT
jgi:hypothetical protein